MANTTYQFKFNWFEKNINLWLEYCRSFQKRVVKIIEIGAFEGASTTWLLDNLLHHKNSRLITVDNFCGGIEHQDSDTYNLDTLEARFWQNINRCNNKNKLRLVKGDSKIVLAGFISKKIGAFDLIYVDGSHVAADVLSDAILAWPLLKVGGFLVFDDYKWDCYRDQFDNPRIAIDCFIKCFAPYFDTIHVSYQVWLRKVERTSDFIKR